MGNIFFKKYIFSRVRHLGIGRKGNFITVDIGFIFCKERNIENSGVIFILKHFKVD